MDNVHEVEVEAEVGGGGGGLGVRRKGRGSGIFVWGLFNVPAVKNVAVVAVEGVGEEGK